jgi:hypothetical protein
MIYVLRSLKFVMINFYFWLLLQKMDHNVDSTNDFNISNDKNQARRERDRARRNSLTAEQKQEINARRRAARQNKALDDRNARQRDSRQNISTEENGDAHLGKLNAIV